MELAEKSRKVDSSVIKICSTVLDLPPSCIEFCVADPEYFIIGTYHLEKDETVPQRQEDGKNEAEKNGGSGEKMPQKRNGSLILFKFKDNEL